MLLLCSRHDLLLQRKVSPAAQREGPPASNTRPLKRETDAPPRRRAHMRATRWLLLLDLAVGRGGCPVASGRSRHSRSGETDHSSGRILEHAIGRYGRHLRLRSMANRYGTMSRVVGVANRSPPITARANARVLLLAGGRQWPSESCRRPWAGGRHQHGADSGMARIKGSPKRAPAF